MLYRVILEIEHLPDDPEDAEDNGRPVVDDNVHTRLVLAIEHSFSAANATFERLAKAEKERAG